MTEDMKNQWKKYILSDAVIFNPKETIPKGKTAKKIAMEKLQSFTRRINGFEFSEFSGGTKFRNGDTLIARITPCLENGKTAQVSILDSDEVGFGSTEYIVLREKEKITYNNFVYYFSINPIFRDIAIQSMVGSSGRQRVQQSVLENIEVLLPPLKQQERIATVLSSLDDKIELNNRINDNLEQQAQAVFKSWFVDFEPFKNGEFVESEGGLIPIGWKQTDLGKIVNILGGGTPNTINPTFWNGEIPFFTPKDVSNNCYSIETEKYITKDGLNNCNSRLYEKNTTFLTARGTVGKISLAGVNMAMNQSCYALQGVNGYTKLFVYHVTKKALGELKHKANGAVFDAITTKDIQSVYITVPPVDIVQKFETIMEKMYQMIHKNCIENFNLVNCRDTLLPKLMSGELSVDDI